MCNAGRQGYKSTWQVSSDVDRHRNKHYRCRNNRCNVHYLFVPAKNLKEGRRRTGTYFSLTKCEYAPTIYIHIFTFVPQIVPRAIVHTGRGLIQVTKRSLPPIYCDVHCITHTIKLVDRIDTEGDTCVKIHTITRAY
jgi:hypothetical protein